MVTAPIRYLDGLRAKSKMKEVVPMRKLFRSFLSAGRKRRCRLAGLALRLLQMLRDIEETEMCRHSDKLDEFDRKSENYSRREYAAIEEECLCCECAVGFLECAIDDLKFAY